EACPSFHQHLSVVTLVVQPTDCSLFRLRLPPPSHMAAAPPPFRLSRPLYYAYLLLQRLQTGTTGLGQTADILSARGPGPMRHDLGGVIGRAWHSSCAGLEGVPKQ